MIRFILRRKQKQDDQIVDTYFTVLEDCPKLENVLRKCWSDENH